MPQLGRQAGGAGGAQAQALGARADRERQLQRLHHARGRAPVGQGPQIRRPRPGIGADPSDDGQPGEGLVGELDPGLMLRESGAPVVRRLVLGQQPRLAHGRLQRRRALDRGDRGRQSHHLGHPGALLAGREVAAHPVAHRARRADVERTPLPVQELVHARAVGQPVGQRPLAALRRADPDGERGELLDRAHADVAHPADQVVQHVDGGPGIRQSAVAGDRRRTGMPGQRRQLVVRHLVRKQRRPGDPGGVDDLRLRPHQAEPGARPAQEAGVVGGVVRDQDRARREIEEGFHGMLHPRRPGDRPVGDAGEGDDQRGDRDARVHQRLELAQDLAAGDLDRADLGDLPRGGRPARRLQVHDDERRLPQRLAEVVEGGLAGGGGSPGASRCGRHGPTIGLGTDAPDPARGAQEEQCRSTCRPIP